MSTQEGFLSFLSCCGEKPSSTGLSKELNNSASGKYFRSPQKVSMMSHSFMITGSRPTCTPPAQPNTSTLKFRPQDLVRLHGHNQRLDQTQPKHHAAVVTEVNKQRTNSQSILPVKQECAPARYKKMYQEQKKANDLSKMELAAYKSRLIISQRQVNNMERQIGRVIRTYWKCPYQNTLQCLQQLIQRMWQENTPENKWPEVSRSKAKYLQISRVSVQTKQNSSSSAQVDNTFGETIRTLVSHIHVLDQEISSLRDKCILHEEQLHLARVRQSSNKQEVLAVNQHLSRMASSNAFFSGEIESMALQLQQQKSLRLTQKMEMQLYTRVFGVESVPKDDLVVPESSEQVQVESQFNNRICKVSSI